MTRYAVDETRGELVATWETGYGAVAVLVAPLAGRIEPQQRQALAAELSGLSEALWRCYTHPASAADGWEVNTEGWRRQGTRDGFSGVTGHLREPNLPDDQGNLIVSYDPVVERAHRVGRCLRPATDADLTSAVIADVEAELDAVERAGLGDLSGRAVQAVQLTRQDASPVQVAAADQVLAKKPLGGDELFVPPQLPPVPAAPIGISPTFIMGCIGLLAWCVPIVGLPLALVSLGVGISNLYRGRNKQFTRTGMYLSLLSLIASTANGAVGAYMGATG
jgi:hypothetical protein